MKPIAFLKSAISSVCLFYCFGLANAVTIDLEDVPGFKDEVEDGDYRYLVMASFKDSGSGDAATSLRKERETSDSDILLMATITSLQSKQTVIFKITTECAVSDELRSTLIKVHDQTIQALYMCIRDSDGTIVAAYFPKTNDGLKYIVSRLSTNDLVLFKFPIHGVTSFINAEGFTKAWADYSSAL